MRYIPIIALLALAACSGGDPEIHTTSVDVDDTQVPALFAAINALGGNRMDVASLVQMSESVPLDQEQEQRLTLQYDGASREIQVHIWREYAGWVHVYVSSDSQALVDAVTAEMARFRRAAKEGG